MPPIIIGGSQQAYFKEVITRRLRSCCELFLRDQNLIADITLSEPGEVALDTFSQSLVGAINEVLAAIIAEDLWDRLGTLVYPHNAGDSVRSDALLYTIGGGLAAASIPNSLSLIHDPAGHQSIIQSSAIVGTILHLNPNGGSVQIGANLSVAGTSYMQDVVIRDDSDLIYGSGNDVRIDWSTAQTNHGLIVGLGSSRYEIICELPDRNIDFGAPNYSDPTTRWQSSDATDVEQYVAKQHDQVNSKEFVGKGSVVTEHLDPVELANGAEFSLPDATAGYMHGIVEDGEEDFYVIWNSTAAVTIRSSSGANVVNTDIPASFCIYPSGTQVFVKNNLGSAKKVMFDYHYWTP